MPSALRVGEENRPPDDIFLKISMIMTTSKITIKKKINTKFISLNFDKFLRFRSCDIRIGRTEIINLFIADLTFTICRHFGF